MLPPGGPCTSETDSRPPAIITGTLSTSTRWAAIAMACRPDEQKRFDGHARDADRRAGAHRRDAGDVGAGRAFRHGAAQDHVLDLAQLDLGALGGVLDDVRAQVGAMGVVEDAAEGLADRRAGGGDDDGVAM